MQPKILVVEDDEQSLYLITFILQRQGIDVIQAMNGIKAVDRAKAETPDLILMDMQLPEMDGFEAAGRIKADPETSDIPIIALTAYAMKGDREKTLRAGCDGYIAKPINPDTVLNEIASFIKGVL